MTRLNSASGARSRYLLGTVVLLAGLGLVVATVGIAASGATPADTPAQQSDAELSVSVDPSTTTATPGEQIVLEVTVENVGNEESVGPVLDLRTLPEGWSVVDQDSPEATYRSSTDEWLWWELDSGEAGQVTLTVETADFQEEATLEFAAHDAADADASTTVTVDEGDEDTGGIIGDGRLLVAGSALAILAVAVLAIASVLWYRRQSTTGPETDGTGESA